MQKVFDKLCGKYDNIISKNSGDIGKTMLVEMEIDTGNHPPIASKPYTLPLKHYDTVQKEIETLERAGIIERSISPWASPVVIVPKKSAPGKPPRRRRCIDYQKINKLQPEGTKADGGKGCISLIPLPKIDELYAKLKGYKVFSSLDLRSGYYHIGLKDSSKLREEQDISMAQEEALERIPNIKKLAGPADTMSLEETEQKISQFCHLWQLYADISVELKKKSELSQDSTVAACRVYVPYMSDIMRQLEKVRKIFAIEKELRTIKNRGYFPVPHINPQEEKIETAKDKDKILERIDEIATAMIQAARQSEENFTREQEQARVRDEQLRSVRQTDRSGLNFFAQANSTPVRNDNSRPDNQGVHFKTNPTRHVYSTTSDDNNPYEPPENDSIILTASPPQTDQHTTSTT